MLQREKFQNCYTVTEFKKDLLLKYWIFTNYNKDRDLTYYTLEVSECHL